MVHFPSLWQTAKKILGSKSRGARLIVVGILLITSGEVLDIIRGILHIPREGSNPLVIMGIIACIWGIMSYVAGAD